MHGRPTIVLHPPLQSHLTLESPGMNHEYHFFWRVILLLADVTVCLSEERKQGVGAPYGNREQEQEHKETERVLPRSWNASPEH